MLNIKNICNVLSNLLKTTKRLKSKNRQLKRRPYTMPKISEMLLKSEGLKYEMSLDLNMGYYLISIIEE